MTPKQNQKRNEELEKLIYGLGTNWFDETLKEFHLWADGEFPEREYDNNINKKGRKKLLKLMEIEWVENKLLSIKKKHQQPK